MKVYGREIAPDRQVTPAEAVSFAIAHLSEQQSAFPERELVRVAFLHGLGDVTLEEIREELPRQGVILDVIDDRLMATTESLQAEERYLAAHRRARPWRGLPGRRAGRAGARPP